MAISSKIKNCKVRRKSGGRSDGGVISTGGQARSIDKVALEQRPRGSGGVALWVCLGNRTPGRGNSKCEGPEAGGERMESE